VRGFLAVSRGFDVRVDFRDDPDGFRIDEYPIDIDHWTEGFILT
jgi:hypothetical protein